MRVIQAAMHLYLDVRQKVACRHATMHPASPDFRVWLQEAVTQWETKMTDLKNEDGSAVSSTDLGLKTAPAGRGPGKDLSPTTLLLAPVAVFSRSSIDSAVDHCKSLLHGRARARLRDTVNSKVRELQEAYSSKKFAYIIRKLGYKEPVPQDPHSLVLPTGEITTNPVRITETITDHFRAHHMRPSNLDPAAVWIHGLQSEDMEAVLSGAPSDQLGEGVANSNIPAPLLQLILEHCRTKVSPEVAAEIAEATAKPVLFHEFNSAIERAKRDKAPGPSGLTPNMLKSLSLSARRYMHNAMSILWEQKHIPQWMKDRMMALIPKKNGSASLDNLRPIGLTRSPPEDLGWHNRAKGSDHMGEARLPTPIAARVSLEQRNGSCHFPRSGQG